MLKIGVIHATCNAVAPLEQAAKNCGEDVTILNFVNENLLFRANQVGGADKEGLRAFTRCFFGAAEAGVDGIIVACSVYTPFVEQMRSFVDVPVIGIDEPMLQAAVEKGSKIGVIATTASSGPSAQRQMEKIAAASGKDCSFQVEIDTEAMTLLRAGDGAGHDRRILEAGKRLVTEGCDCLVLAQITMARAAVGMSELGIPVFTSPAEGIRKIVSLIH